MARILTIDDSQTVCCYLRVALGSDGHEVDDLKLLAQLPVVLAGWNPDLIILDLNMPALSGQSVGKFIRRFEPRPIAILIHSSLEEAELSDAAKELGAVGYIKKGGGVTELCAIVRNALCPQA